MIHRNFRSRRGLSITEVVVAATLVVSMIGIVVPLAVRTGRVWQSTRQYRLACNELSNQMELLTSIGETQCKAELSHLKISDLLADSLPGARLQGELVSDHDGTRLVLNLDWERGSKSVPIALVGWLNIDSVESASSHSTRALADGVLP